MYSDFRPQTCTNGLVFRECKPIKNIFEDVCFTKNSFHITLTDENDILNGWFEYFKGLSTTDFNDDHFAFSL
jgi:hypothetical protein